MKAVVYHIEDPRYPNDINQGYVGIVSARKGAYNRFRQHARPRSALGPTIKELDVDFDKHVKILFEGEVSECRNKEKEYRPYPEIGWNTQTGGAGIADFTLPGLDNNRKLRSSNQSRRMADPELRKQQSKTFKQTYYSDEKRIALRKLRAKEHMADPDKKAAALAGVHKKKKCPHCDYENNPGNIAIHIKKVHNDL